MSRMDEGRRFLPIVNRLRQLNTIVDHLRWMAASDTDFHRFLIRTNEPRGYWREVGSGFRPEHSETGIETESIGVMGTMSEVKDEYLRESKNPMQIRYQEDAAFADGLAKTMAMAVIYASQVNDARSFDGIAVRLNNHGLFNVASGGATGNNTESIYMAEHGEDGLFMVFPSGIWSPGIHMIPRPPQYVDYSSTDDSRVWTHFTEFHFRMGMCVKHHRGVMRYANLNSGGATATNAWSLQTFLNLIKETWNPGGRGMRAYISRNMWAQLNWQAQRMGIAGLAQGSSGAQETLSINQRGPSLSPPPVSSMYGIGFHIVEQIGGETAVPAS